MDIIAKLAEEFHIRTAQVEQTVALIDEGNTIPFIARYRKEVTGGLSDVVLRDLDERLKYLRNLEERKEEVLRLIEEQGKLTEGLKAEIEKAEVLQRVEDLYKPFKQKKATRASKAKEKGLEPLAMILYAQQLTDGAPEDAAAPFVNPEKEVYTPQEALAGACDIIAEMIADDREITKDVRAKTLAIATLVTEAVDPEEKTVYEMYYDRAEALAKIPNHRVLAINRGEKEKKLKVKLSLETEKIHELIAASVIRNEKSIFYEMLQGTIADAYKRLMAPSIEREMRNLLTERAEAEAVKIFAKNTESLLMTQTAPHARPDLTRCVVAPNGDYACFAGLWYNNVLKCGYLEPLCTRPAYRGMGLARSVLYTQMREIRAMGGLTFTGGDQPFYLSAGYQPHHTYAHFCKEY